MHPQQNPRSNTQSQFPYLCNIGVTNVPKCSRQPAPTLQMELPFAVTAQTISNLA